MSYKVSPTSLSGALLLEPAVFGDSRGFVFEAWNKKKFEELGIHASFVQDNVSSSEHGVIRGFHFQNPNAQGKLITVLKGEVFDVAVDLRKSSPTFGQWTSFVLSEENKKIAYIPAGFAHGYAVTGEKALFHYKCTDFYAPQAEICLRWDDPQLKIKWPLQNPSLSERDKRGLMLAEIPKDRLFD